MWVSKYTNTVDPMGLDKKPIKNISMNVMEGEGWGQPDPKRFAEEAPWRWISLADIPKDVGFGAASGWCQEKDVGRVHVSQEKKRPLVGWIILGTKYYPVI